MTSGAGRCAATTPTVTTVHRAATHPRMLMSESPEVVSLRRYKLPSHETRAAGGRDARPETLEGRATVARAAHRAGRRADLRQQPARSIRLRRPRHDHRQHDNRGSFGRATSVDTTL